MCGGRGGGVGGRRGGGVGTHIRTRTHHQYYVTGPEGLSVKRQHERTQTGCGWGGGSASLTSTRGRAT